MTQRTRILSRIPRTIAFAVLAAATLALAVP